MRLRVSMEIERPIAEVFHFYADQHVENHPRWDPDVKLTKVSSGPLGVGSVIERLITRMGREVRGEMTVVEFDRDRTFAVEINDGADTMVGRATFTPLGDNRTSMELDVDAPTIEDPEIGKAVEGLMGRSAANIKTLIEAA